MGTESAESRLLHYEIQAPFEARSEAELVQRAKDDPAAFGQLYEAHYSRILNYIYRSVLNVAVAEELTSNTFFKALRALPKYRHRGYFRAWLYRIATNEIRMYWRDKKKARTTALDNVSEDDLARVYFTSADAEGPLERQERIHRYAQLRTCLSRLPERYQAAIVLRYFEELPYDEVAKVLGKRLGTVKSLVHRGLKRLRHLMDERGATFS